MLGLRFPRPKRSPLELLRSVLSSCSLVLFSQFALALVPWLFPSISFLAMLPIAGQSQSCLPWDDDKMGTFFSSISVMFRSFGYGGDDSIGEIIEASTWCFCICSGSSPLQYTVRVGSLRYHHPKRLFKIFDGSSSRCYFVSLSFISSTCVLL